MPVLSSNLRQNPLAQLTAAFERMIASQSAFIRVNLRLEILA